MLLQPGCYSAEGGSFRLAGQVCLFGLPLGSPLYGMPLRGQHGYGGETPCCKGQVVLRADGEHSVLSNEGFSQLWNLVLLQESSCKGSFCVESVKNVMLLQNCYLSSSSFSAVGVQASGMWLQNCTMARCAQAGVFGLRQAKVSLRRCLVADNTLCGMALLSESVGYVRDSLLLSNGDDGVRAANASNLVMVGSRVQDCGGHGVRICDTGHCSLRDMEVSGCRKMGVHCANESGKLTMYGCRVLNNKHDGIFVHSCSGAFFLMRNELRGNQQGIEIRSRHAMIFQNRFLDNPYGSLVIRNGCQKLAIGQNEFISGPEALRIGLNAQLDFLDNEVRTGRITIHAVAGEEQEVDELMELMRCSNELGPEPANVVVFERGADEIKSATLRNVCTGVYTGRSFFAQIMSQCLCCSLSVCAVCARVCHAGHNVIEGPGRQAAYCHCSEGFECKCYEKNRNCSKK